MKMKTRPAACADLSFEYGGRPYPVCVSSFYGLDPARHVDTQFLRPRKRFGKWVVRKFLGDRPLLVRVADNSFVANASDHSILDEARGRAVEQ